MPALAKTTRPAGFFSRGWFDSPFGSLTTGIAEIAKRGRGSGMTGEFGPQARSCEQEAKHRVELSRLHPARKKGDMSPFFLAGLHGFVGHHASGAVIIRPGSRRALQCEGAQNPIASASFAGSARKQFARQVFLARMVRLALRPAHHGDRGDRRDWEGCSSRSKTTRFSWQSA
jgi:hypothetical protein